MTPRQFRVASLVAFKLFVGWSLLVFAWPPMRAFDLSIAESLRDFDADSDFWDGFMIFWTWLANVKTIAVVAAVVFLVTIFFDRRFATAWVIVLLGCSVLNWGLKEFFDRDRPPEEMRNKYVREFNESYPSGHAMGSTVAYGFLAVAILRRTQRRRVVFVVAPILVSLICLSRVYLRAHWFSDVVGGSLFGLAYLWFCLAWLPHKMSIDTVGRPDTQSGPPAGNDSSMGVVAPCERPENLHPCPNLRGPDRVSGLPENDILPGLGTRWVGQTLCLARRVKRLLHRGRRSMRIPKNLHPCHDLRGPDRVSGLPENEIFLHNTNIASP